MKKIAITGDKGGVGKSTIAGLLAQWFEYKNYTVNILDADPNRTIYMWLEKCKSSNYDFCTTKESNVLVIDTAGTAGHLSELTQWSGSLTRLVSDLGQARQKYVSTIPF
jgi:cellulose biosynthesis protein BcsQ